MEMEKESKQKEAQPFEIELSARNKEIWENSEVLYFCFHRRTQRIVVLVEELKNISPIRQDKLGKYILSFEIDWREMKGVSVKCVKEEKKGANGGRRGWLVYNELNGIVVEDRGVKHESSPRKRGASKSVVSLAMKKLVV